MRQSPKSPPPLRAGQRLRKGEIANIGAHAIHEVVGGNGVQVKSYGNRHSIAVKNKKGAGVAGTPRLVAVLPPIPAGYDVVTWASSTYVTGGTGDDQIWECDGRVGQTYWTPRQYLTSRTGAPL